MSLKRVGSLLRVDALLARHGLLEAVRGISFEVAKGETLALVGANGAGKTTLMRTLAGAHRAASGHVVYDGRDITALLAHKRVAMGIALVPEGRRLFAAMSVEDNLKLAQAAGRPGRWTVATVIEAFPNLEKRLKVRAGTLSGGEQQATAIGRALMANPDLLLLDEVSLGLSPLAVDLVYKSLDKLIAGGTTIVLVEQDLARAQKVADRIICMLEGRIVLDEPAKTLSRERITDAYFGLAQREHA